MQSIIQSVEATFKKDNVTDVKSGDTVRVHQKIQEGEKVRTQVFEGLVIATKRPNSLTSSITVRRIASGVGVEKTFLLHSPAIQKIDVMKRSKVRRNKLNYMKTRSGKSARLTGVEFDRDSVNQKQNIKLEVPKTEDRPTDETEVKQEAKETKAEEAK